LIDEDDYDDDQQYETGDVPQKLNKLRACMVCGLVKEYKQFLHYGCDNCQVLQIQGEKDKVDMTTTPNFTGFVAMMHPDKSWVAKWKRMRPSYVPGLYAISVQGRLANEFINTLHDHGIEYHPLDQD